LVKIYSKQCSTLGAGTINPRIVIGAFIIKHIGNYTDEDTIQIISENPYMQFFLGLEDFTTKPLRQKLEDIIDELYKDLRPVMKTKSIWQKVKSDKTTRKH